MKYHRHPYGGSGVIEGREGVAISRTSGAIMRLPAGWVANADMEAQGFDVFDAPEPPMPPGHLARGGDGLAVRGGALIRDTAPAPEPDLDLAQFELFLDESGLRPFHDALLAAVQPSSPKPIRLALYRMTRGPRFRFTETLAASRALAAALNVAGAPNFADPAVIEGFRAKWREAAAAALPTA